MAVLFLGLTACDGGRESHVSPPDAETETSATFRILLVGDPFAMALSRSRPLIEERLGVPVELEIVGYNDGRRLMFLNQRDEVSRFDLVAFDVVWLGELHTRGTLLDLNHHLSLDRGIFLRNALAAAEMNGALYGLPIQPHAELLWVRRDWLEASGMEAPRTTEEVLAFARAMHDPANGRYGIAWNAQRGQPLGQTIAHFFAAFGVALLDERGLPAFNTEAGLEAVRFARALSAYSPPDIFSMAWDQRTTRFASGQVAMTYGWGARSYMAEEEPYSAVIGRVLYLPAPHAPGGAPATPLGVWALGIPSNVSARRRSIRALEALFDEEVQQRLVYMGNASPPLRVLAEDPGLQARYPVLATMAALDASDQLSMDIRPRIPLWDALCHILGTEFHDMLLGRFTPEEAMDRAFMEAQALFLPSLEARGE